MIDSHDRLEKGIVMGDIGANEIATILVWMPIALVLSGFALTVLGAAQARRGKAAAGWANALNGVGIALFGFGLLSIWLSNVATQFGTVTRYAFTGLGLLTVVFALVLTHLGKKQMDRNFNAMMDKWMEERMKKRNQ